MEDKKNESFDQLKQFLRERKGKPMTFWSGETLLAKMPTLVSDFDPDKIDCAAYTLSDGPEVYVTPDHDIPKNSSHTKMLLNEHQPFTIPAGQFAFILAKEFVEVPDDAIAFISMKAAIKFKGLINVSGFHVDPGYKGRLIFAAFNAGPSPIHLEQGMPLFLTWYASLDRHTIKKKTAPGHEKIPPAIINGIPGEVYSFRMMSDKLKDIETKTVTKVHSLEKLVIRLLTIFGVFATIAVGTAVIQVREIFFTDATPQKQTQLRAAPGTQSQPKDSDTAQ